MPSDVSPLCSPRFGFSQPNKSGFISISPFEGPPVAPAPVISGRPAPGNGTIPLSPFFGFTPDGQYVPLMPIPYGGLPTYANNEQFAPMTGPWSNGPSAPGLQPVLNPAAVQGFAGNVAPLSTGQQVQALEREQTKLNEEYRNVDQAGVIHQGVLNAVQRAALVTRKVSLTNRLDEIRVSLKKLRTSEDSISATTPPEKIAPAFGQPLPKPPRSGLTASQLPVLNQSAQMPGTFANFPYFQMHHLYPVPPSQAEPQPQVAGASSTPFLAPSGPRNNFRTFSVPTPSLANEPPAAPYVVPDPGSSTEQPMRSPASAQISHEPRRSHAIAIKNPQEYIQQGGVHSQKSSLDPTRYWKTPSNLN